MFIKNTGVFKCPVKNLRREGQIEKEVLMSEMIDEDERETCFAELLEIARDLMDGHVLVRLEIHD